MTEIRRGRQYENGPVEPFPGQVKPLGDAAGHMLHAMLNPETYWPPGPPYTHTYAVFEEIGEPPRTSILHRLWRSRCRWHLRRHQPAVSWLTHSLTSVLPDPERDRRPRDCANCGRRL